MQEEQESPFLSENAGLFTWRHTYQRLNNYYLSEKLRKVLQKNENKKLLNWNRPLAHQGENQSVPGEGAFFDQ